ncbi:synemin [Gastrophryne carolinensis]
MLYVRRGFGDEKSQLNELNYRLDQYLSRVRHLEGENQRLVEEINRLRTERGTEWANVYHAEMSELRRKVEELTIEKCEAQLQKNNLMQELQDLQDICEQVRSIRLKIEQQLAHYKQDLQKAQKGQAALEELYNRLLQEHQMLQSSHEEDLLAVRNQTFLTPLQITMQEVSRPMISLEEVQSFSLELSETWKDAFVYYQKKIEELENIVRLGEVDRHGAEEEALLHRLQVEKLQKEYEELLSLRTMLENELLRMRGKYRLEVEEYQIIIEQLENERQDITVSIAQRLKDYHDLMQVKTGLSLEVAAYRALLEAESKKDTVIVTEHTIRDRPAGYVTSVFEDTAQFPSRRLHKIDYPYNKNKDTIRWNAQTNFDRFVTQTASQPQKSPIYTNTRNVSYDFGNAANEKSGRQDFSTRYGSLHKSEVTSPYVPYQKAQHKAATPYASTQSTVISKTTTQEQVQNLKPVARPRTHSKEARKEYTDIKVESKQPELDSQRAFETKVAQNRIKESKIVEERHIKERNQTERNENQTTEETVSVTEAVPKEIVQESKAQELPVKKERKKREQAKKRKEEDNVATGDGNVTEGSKVACESIHVKTSTIFGKEEDDDKVLEIPIQLEKVKQGDISRNVKHQGDIDESYTAKIILENRDEKTLVDNILRQLHPADISSSDKNEGSKFMRSFVFGEMEDNQAVRVIPIQVERSKKETGSDKNNAENLERCRFSLNKEGSLTFNDKESEHNEFQKKEESTSFATESFDKKALVTDILRQIGHPSDLTDSNVTYIERKKECSDGTTKTEILVQSKIEEEMDLFDEPDLKDLWNTTSMSSAHQESGASNISAEEIQSKKIRKTILEDITGAEAEEWIGNVIHTELKGAPGKSVNVEIVEESIGTFAYEKGECSTPFLVEEAEDHIKESATAEGLYVSKSSDKIKDSIPLHETPAQVEEISGGDHADEELNYFVSIPDENLYQEEEEEEETIRGQIHTEEESHVKYSWQDEFLQGSQGRKSLSEMLKQAVGTEQDLETYKASQDSSDTLEREEQKEESHSETIVVEKKTTFESSSVERDNELQHKTEHKNEESYVESIGKEKSAAYGSSVDSINNSDKQENKEKSHAEIIMTDKASVGSSVDWSDIFDIEEEKGMSGEKVVIERKITVPHEIQSSIMDLLSKDIKDPQQKLKGTIECLQESLPKELVEELALLAREEQTQTSSLSMDIKKVGSAEESGKMTIVAEICVSKTLDEDNIADLDFSQGKSSHYILQKEDITERYPTSTQIHLSPTQEISLGQISSDVNRIIKHIEFDTSEKIFHEESLSDQDSSGKLSPTEISRSEHHIKIGPRETFSSKEIIFEGPVTEALKLDFSKNTDDASEQNRSIRHITISPTESATAEQIIFQGPIFKTSSLGDTVTVQKKQIDNVGQAAQSLVLEKFQIGNQDATSQGTESAVGVSNTVSHFKVNSGETFTKQILFEGSMPRIYDFRLNTVDTDHAEEDNRPFEHSSPTPKIQVAKQMKHQGFVSEQHTLGDYESTAEPNFPTNFNTSVHHIKLSPSKEHIVFEDPISSNLQISGEEYAMDANQSSRHILFGSPEMHVSEHVSFELPTTESYESSDFIVSSPSGNSTESERSIKHIKLGPKEKSFTFQMDISKVSTTYSGEGKAQESGSVITSSMFEGQPEHTKSSTEFVDDTEVAESGYGEEEIAGVAQFAYKVLPHSQNIAESSELDKEVQMQRIVHQSHVVSDEKKVAIVYLDEEDEDESDQDYLRRSF